MLLCKHHHQHMSCDAWEVKAIRVLCITVGIRIIDGCACLVPDLYNIIVRLGFPLQSFRSLLSQSPSNVSTA